MYMYVDVNEKNSDKKSTQRTNERTNEMNESILSNVEFT